MSMLSQVLERLIAAGDQGVHSLDLRDITCSPSSIIAHIRRYHKNIEIITVNEPRPPYRAHCKRYYLKKRD